MSIETMVRLSERFKVAGSIEELQSLRDECREEVKTLPRDEQEWLLWEWESARRVFDLPSISDKELEKIWKKEAKREAKGQNNDGGGVSSSRRVGGSGKVKGRYGDYGLGWEQAKQ